MAYRYGRRRTRMPALARVFILALSGLLLMAAGPDTPSSIQGDPGGTTPEQVTTAPVPETAPAAEQAVVPQPVEPRIADEPVWKDGELIALPRDPDARAAARAQARANTAAKKTRMPAATYTPTQVGPTQPVMREKWADPHPSRAGAYQPTPSELENTSLSIPDDFEMPAELVRRITEESGTIDRAAEQEMAGVFAQALIQNFHGISQTNLTPPDCDLAVGPQHVVVVVNSDYAVYDYCGNLLASGDLGNLTNFDYFLFDPKVIYDEWDSRWVIAFVAKDTPNQLAWIRVVISTGTLPPGVGSSYYYSYLWTNNGGYWGDYPDLGVDPDAVYITTNDFNWSNSFQRARITALDKLEIYNSAGSSRDEFFAMTNPGDGTLAFALRAAEMKSDPGEYYLVSSKSGGASFLSWFEILGTPTSGFTLNSYNIPCGTYDNPPNMLQGDGSYADCGDARLLTAKYYSSRLWTTHAQRIAAAGGAGDESAIEVYIINTVTRTIAQETGPFHGGADLFYCYPAVDFDIYDRGVVCFLRGGVSVYPEARYVDLTEGGSFSGSSLLIAGTDWKDDGSNAGTNADPYRLGDYNGCDLNRAGDNRTLWFHGHRAVANGDWDTQVGAVSYDGAGVMSVTPATNPLESFGLVGGPFTPSGHAYTVENTGGARIPWQLSGVASWNTPTATSGFLNPGQTTVVSVNINSNANGFGAGVYTDNYSFSECMSGAVAARGTRLTVGTVGDCDGSIADLDPGIPYDFSAGAGTFVDRGAYITALQDFRVCAIGVEADLDLPQTITARIYADNGGTRGALLASGSHTVVVPGKVTHYVPINFTFQACQEYDIAIQFGSNNGWDWWDDRPITPFDVGGVIRVRDGESVGSASNFALMHFTVIGSVPDSPELTDLGYPDAPPGEFGADPFGGQRGIYVIPQETFHLNTFGWLVDVPGGVALTANIYEASGLTRGDLIASGNYVSPGSGQRWHDIPVNVVLEEGKEYDLSIAHPTIGAWEWWNENNITEPFTVGRLRVLDGESLGGAGNFALPHFRVNNGPYVAGFPLNLAKPTGPQIGPVSQDFSQYGAFIESQLDQEVYSLGWFANVPEGEVITARVYSASGTTIGTLLSEGTILSSGGGVTWHDVPVAASLGSGQDYAIDIEWNNVTGWSYWSDNDGGLPYNVQNRITVVEGMSQSAPNPDPADNTALIHMRLTTCEPTLTDVDDGPVTPPSFALHAPYPNPTRNHTRLGFSMDEAGPVTMTLYNVAGQRVRTIMNEQRPIGPGEVQLDTRGLAAGVYFVKMATPTRSVSRKITIVR